jgi:hypothetical protein
MSDGGAHRRLVRRGYGMQSSWLGMRRESYAHQEHARLDGEVNGRRHRRDCSLPASGKKSSSETISSAAVRFPLQEEQVEDGDADGGHGEAWDCLNRWR